MCIRDRCVLYQHLRSRLPVEAARFVVVALAFSPYSLYFSAPYTESLYLMLMVCAMHCAHQRSWVWAGLFAAALSATRNLGVFVILPMAWMAVQPVSYTHLDVYKRQAAGQERYAAMPYAFARLADGTLLPDCARRAVRRHLDWSRPRPPLRSAAGAQFVIDFLTQPVDELQPPVSRVALQLYEDRVDLQAAFPDMLGGRREAYLNLSLIHI